MLVHEPATLHEVPRVTVSDSGDAMLGSQTTDAPREKEKRP
jgi:hypothetical protein